MSKVYESKSNGQKSNLPYFGGSGSSTGESSHTQGEYKVGGVYQTMTGNLYRCVDIIKNVSHGYIFESENKKSTFIFYLDKHGRDRNGKKKMKGGVRKSQPKAPKVETANLLRAFEAVCDRLDRLETHLGVRSTSTSQVKSFLNPDERSYYRSLSPENRV